MRTITVYEEQYRKEYYFYLGNGNRKFIDKHTFDLMIDAGAKYVMVLACPWLKDQA